MKHSKLTNLLTALLLLFCFLVLSQKKTSRNWSSFVQSIQVNTDKKVKFKLVASVKANCEHNGSKAGLWVRVDNKAGATGFFENSVYNKPIVNNEWGEYSVEGYIDEDSESINFGGIAMFNGLYYFDDFKLYTENKNGKYELLNIENSSFEITKKDNVHQNWVQGVRVFKPVSIKQFEYSLSKDRTHGKRSLLIIARELPRDTTKLIGPINGFSPQIGTIITMLNNLSTRIESVVAELSQEETDYLLDDKANSIGALVKHLVATEVLYQAYTFEDRDYNDAEEKKWRTAMNLGKKGQEDIKGKEIQYYLDEWKKVRKKTIEELKKRDDTWLAKTFPGSDINNHYSWFHVMEHQSSHLGQILMLKKRLPEFPKEIELQEKIKD
jgi:uncharacterized damage-inducible protein DinB